MKQPVSACCNEASSRMRQARALAAYRAVIYSGKLLRAQYDSSALIAKQTADIGQILGMHMLYDIFEG